MYDRFCYLRGIEAVVVLGGNVGGAIVVDGVLRVLGVGL